MSTDEGVGFWAIVEVMGHKKYAGLVSEHIFGGSSMVRVDVPAHDGCQGFSKMFGTGSIYCITPVAEQVARAAAQRFDERPVLSWDLPEEWRAKINQGLLIFDEAANEPEPGDWYPNGR